MRKALLNFRLFAAVLEAATFGVIVVVNATLAPFPVFEPFTDDLRAPEALLTGGFPFAGSSARGVFRSVESSVAKSMIFDALL